MQLEQRVRDGVERIGEIAPLSPMAKLEIDGVLTALCETVATEAWASAFEVAARCAERRGCRDVATATRALIPTPGGPTGEAPPTCGYCGGPKRLETGGRWLCADPDCPRAWAAEA